MKETGEDFRRGKIVVPQLTESAATSNQVMGVQQEQFPANSAVAGHQ